MRSIVGTTIGRYKLLEKIGEGGMGVVFMAEQREPVVRKVVAFSPDGTRLAAMSDRSEAVKLFDMETHHELLTLPGEGSEPTSPAFSPDGKMLGRLSGSLGVLQIWRAPSWQEIEAAHHPPPAIRQRI